MEIVTGFHGRPHIRPAQLARLVAGLARKGRYVLDQQDGLSATMLTANSVRIGTGDLVMDGYHFTNEAPIDLAIESGVTGQNRNDLVVCRYSLEASEASEENTHPRRRQRGDLIILKGVPSSGSASDPTCSTATITPDTETADFPLYRIPISGLSVGTPVPLFSTSPTLWDCLSQKLVAKLENGYYGMKQPDGTDSWIRTTPQGLIPEKQSSPTASLGTTGWRFANVWSTKYNGKTLLDWMHPVNDVVLRFDKTSPASLWGGTWTQIATGRVLRAANDTNTGGADSETISFNHTHAQRLVTGKQTYFTRSGIKYGEDDSVLAKSISTHRSDWLNDNGSGEISLAQGLIGTKIALGNKTISRLQAYQNVYVWRRTA